MEKKELICFTAETKIVRIWQAGKTDCPVIYLHTFSDDGAAVYEALRGMQCPEFHFVVISNLDWNCDMSPWKAEPVLKNGDAFSGGADGYLEHFLRGILPEAEKRMGACPPWRGIAGYSMAGLFAVYVLFQTALFSRCASVSGSLWYPGIKEYILSHEMKEKPRRMYFSVGDRESRSGSPVMRTVQRNTEEIAECCRKRGIDTIFQLNKGNHFRNPVKRTAAGICRLLSEEIPASDS